MEIRNLVINIPPRHAKSLIASVFWFCWDWIRTPSKRWIFTSYGADLSRRDSEKCRMLIRSAWYQARWGHTYAIRRNDDRQAKFANDRLGYRIATSTTGIGTGEGGDVIVADDPHKTDEAVSEAARQRVLRNWSGTMSTRANDPKTIVKLIIMQRLEERDLSGHSLAEGMGYEHLCLPAEYEPKRYFLPQEKPTKAQRDIIIPTSLQVRRPELLDGPTGSKRQLDGDLLWPQRFNKEDIRTLKKELRGAASGQLQQRPSPEEGTIFQSPTFRYFTEDVTTGTLLLTLGQRGEGLPTPAVWRADQCRWYQTVDTALKISETSAWTVVGTFALTPDRRLLIWHIFRERVPVPKQYEALMQMRNGVGVYDADKMRWTRAGASDPWPMPLMYQAVEDKASGIGLIQQAAMEGKPMRILKADGDKVRRAATLATMLEAGCVFFRQSAVDSWLPDFEGELLSFPVGAFKDQVDVAAYAAQLAMEDALTGANFTGSLVYTDERSAPEGYDMVTLPGGTMVDFEEQSWWNK
jgi:predicted phage terminase large subunit-like protein